MAVGKKRTLDALAKISLICALLVSTADAAKKMVLVPGQTFMMGDSNGAGIADQKPAHPVTLSPYYISDYLCTVQEYCDFLNESDCPTDEKEQSYIIRGGSELSPYRDQGEVLVIYPGCPITKQNDKYIAKPGTANKPMYQVTWEGAALYCNWRSEKEGLTRCYKPDQKFACDFAANGYHLPTEAQWECAARAGYANRIYPWGDKITDQNANYNNNLGEPSDLGSFPANDYGLYDMAGNVMEWCHDWYSVEYYKHCESGAKDPTGPTGGVGPEATGFHVMRGGTYYQPAEFQTCAYRYGTADTKGCFTTVGFRLARQSSSKQKPLLKRTQANKAETKITEDWLANVIDKPLSSQAHAGELPFSFVLGGKKSSKLINKWKVTSTEETIENGKTFRIVRLTDPRTGLEFACEVTTFEKFPAVDLVLRITNNGDKDSPIIEDVSVLDHIFNRNSEDSEFILRHSRGSRASVLDFAPRDEILGANAKWTLGGHGGRSSDQALPFMNLSWGNTGMVMAVGWTGQWQVRLDRDDDRGLHTKVGMQGMHLKLHPKENIRTPRVLIVFWNGENMYRGHNLFRQIMLAHYSPRINGKLVIPPISSAVGGLNGYTEQNQLAAIPKLKERGVEVLWIDAGWFVGQWPFGAGNWVPRPEMFPRGLGPVGRAAHKAGMDFLVWFEQERVSRRSRIHKDFPQWCIGPITEYGGLYNWGIPEAQQWMTDFLSEQIEAGEIDIFRQDFNMEPLSYWQRNDTTHRRGMTEIRFVEGMYEMWDQLRKRHPGLWIDNCASGGRMIDLETSTRSIPLWQSDAQCGGCPEMTCQLQNGGLNLYLPFHTGGCFGLEPSYAFRSAMMSGNPLCLDACGATIEQVKNTVDTYKKARPYFEGDYYPLFDHIADETAWYGYQLHRPDLQKGMILVFRRNQSRETTKTIALYDIDDDATYDLVNKDEKTTQTISGEQLRAIAVKIDKTADSRMLFYERKLYPD